MMIDQRPDLVCFSHLRWGFVFQRPNHLMSRFAAERRVLFVEEPIDREGPPRVRTSAVSPGLLVCTPELPGGAASPEEAQRALLRAFLQERGVRRPTLWLYTPMALPLVEGLAAGPVIYDCMDELSAFLHAPPALVSREEALLRRADLVFTGGRSLCESKRGRRPDARCFPSSVDAAHFSRARGDAPEPDDQREIPRPRVGYAGVVDERLDLALLDRVARERPDYHLVIVGPVVKIDEACLPRRANIHYLGGKRYEDLPAYLAGWDVAMMPFALNEATRFISPTKTLEYLAAGRSIVSTAIRDVVRPYGESGVVRVAGPEGFAAAIDAALADDRAEHARRSAEVLASTSWDRTWEAMAALVHGAERRGQRAPTSERGTRRCSTT